MSLFKKTFVFRDDDSLSRIKHGLFRELKDLDLTKPKQIVITDYKENKTDAQRSGFHTLCGWLAVETGNTQAAVKEAIKKQVLGVETITLSGEPIEVTRSSEEAKRDEYSRLIEGVYIEAGSMGILLPELRK